MATNPHLHWLGQPFPMPRCITNLHFQKYQTRNIVWCLHISHGCNCHQTNPHSGSLEARVLATNKERAYGFVRPNPTKRNQSRKKLACLGGTPPKLDGNVSNNHLHTTPTTPIFLTNEIVSTRTSTVVPWRLGFRQPTKNECMGWFTQTLQNKTRVG